MDVGYEVYEYSRRGDLDSLKEVLEGGMHPDEYLSNDGASSLVVAARSGSAAVVRELVKHGADVALRTLDGSTMLHHAVSGGSPEVLSALLGASSKSCCLNPDEKNEDGMVPLILAAHYGSLPLVKLLLDAGADVNLVADGWGTALDCAEGEVASFLEQRGAKPSECGRSQPMAAAAERFSYGCFESGADITSGLTAAKKNVVAEGADTASWGNKRPAVGDRVQLAQPKSGVLRPGDIGVVIEDDGSDCLPLKVALQRTTTTTTTTTEASQSESPQSETQSGSTASYDYYDPRDLFVLVAETNSSTNRATPEGTRSYMQGHSVHPACAATLADTGLMVSPVGFGCHRLEDSDRQKAALEAAVSMGCNFLDLAPNYTDGVAEEVAGSVLHKLFSEGKVRRDQIVVASKVGNVLGKQLVFAKDQTNIAKINDDLLHCIAPEWIEQEISRSLERLQLTALDCLLLHCPEFEEKAPDVSMSDVYARLKAAFEHLEKEVSRGRISMYGISAAFVPLRPTDPEHLHLPEVMRQLPADHHFRVIQLPVNFAEADVLWVGHTPRNPDGTAVVPEQAFESPSLPEMAKEFGLSILSNRPLDGIYKEAHGVLRFSSLDCNVRAFSELQLDNCDVLEEHLTSTCSLDSPPFGASEGAGGELAAKTVKVLASLNAVDVVLLGMRQPEYVLGTLPLLLRSPPIEPTIALSAVRSAHSRVSMWFATAAHEADHGTAKSWRLPVAEKFVEPPCEA